LRHDRIAIGTIIFAAVEERDHLRIVRTVVRLLNHEYNVHGNVIFIFDEDIEYAFRHVLSTNSGSDKNIAPVIFIENPDYLSDYIGKTMYAKKFSDKMDAINPTSLPGRER
jgi:hypothetical protein